MSRTVMFILLVSSLTIITSVQTILHDNKGSSAMTTMEKGCLKNVGNVTGMSLDIVSTFGSNLKNNLNGRRLLHDREGYPTWFSHVDRKLLSTLNKVQPNAVVAKDGSGQFKTINDAINSYPENYHGKFVIYVKTGIYAEYIIVDKNKPNILLYGDGPTKTIITGRKSVAYDNVETMHTATFCKLIS